MSDTSGASAQLGLSGGYHDYTVVNFHVNRLMAKLRTMIPVKIIKVYKQDRKTTALQGEVAGAGFVDVQPLVSMVDGSNNASPHGIVYGLPYTRVYGGVNAHIMDPIKGDFGYIHCADRDIQSFISNAQQGNSQGGSGGQGGSGAGSQSQSGMGGINPGSFRRFDLADGIYLGGVLNAKPKQYMTYTSTGMQLRDMNKNTITLDKTGASDSNTADTFGSGTATGQQAQNTKTGVMGIQHADFSQNLLQMFPQQFNMLSSMDGTTQLRKNTGANSAIQDNSSGTNGTYSCNATSSISDTAQNINHNGITNIVGNFNMNNASPLVSASNITAPQFFGVYNPPSDARTKSDHEPFTDALNLVNQLEVKWYTQGHYQVEDGKVVPFKDPVSKEPAGLKSFKSFGVHAQDCRKVIPEIVVGDENKHILSVQEAKFGLLAVAAIQELVSEIAELKSRIVELETDINAGKSHVTR